MRLLLDTHALLWLLNDDDRLGKHARDLVTDRANVVWVSIASLWEIAIKTRSGKLQADAVMISAAAAATGLDLLDLRITHLAALSRLPAMGRHRDPFDHLLVAQAISEDLTFVSDDAHVGRYPVNVLRCS